MSRFDKTTCVSKGVETGVKPTAKDATSFDRFAPLPVYRWGKGQGDTEHRFDAGLFAHLKRRMSAGDAWRLAHVSTKKPPKEAA